MGLRAAVSRPDNRSGCHTRRPETRVGYSLVVHWFDPSEVYAVPGHCSTAELRCSPLADTGESHFVGG